jgi:hypothetical protein
MFRAYFPPPSQGLKPILFYAIDGTDESVPFQNTALHQPKSPCAEPSGAGAFTAILSTKTRKIIRCSAAG